MLYRRTLITDSIFPDLRSLLITCLFSFYLVYPAFSQLAPELNYPVQKYKVNSWKASWIRCQGAPEADYGVILFRKSFNLSDKPKAFIIHVSADNRYKLFVNGVLVSIGPQLSDTRHWRYETIDIAPYLTSGSNIIAAEVANWGPDRFFGIVSLRTAFLMQGESDDEKIVNTPEGWKAFHNEAFYPLHLNWIYGVDIVGGFYASNPGDSVIVERYPQNWNSLLFDDTKWKKAEWIWKADNANDAGHYWLMKPRTTPQVVQKVDRFARIARTVGMSVDPEFLNGKQITVVPDSKVSILLDFEKITIGFPELVISGGSGAKITVRYAENLLNADLSKGDRNIVENKKIRGIHDVIMPDGRKNFHFTPLWYRAFRYVQLDIETKDHPLDILDFHNKTTLTPSTRKAIFETSDPVYKKIDDICWYTSYICTQDNLISDAYYEQMMYVADSKVHALVNLYLTGDDIWLKNAIEQFNYSRLPNGLLTSCYPLRASFYHINFSLYWIDMIHDFMMHCNDREFVRAYAGNIRETLQWFEENKNEKGLIARNFGKLFIDWYNDIPFAGKGLSPGSENGNSATITLQYAYTLMHAAEIFEYLGMHSDAMMCRKRAEKVKDDVYKACWNPDRRLFSENPGGNFFDERANLLAIKAGMFDRKFQKELFIRCMDDSTISKPVYFFRFHTFDIMRELGVGEYFDKQLDIWKKLLPLNLTTTPEREARQRSDAHPWSAYPSVAFIKVVAGIMPAEPEFKSVDIAPVFGHLQYIKASYPHYRGDIKIDLRKNNDGGVEGTLELPAGLKGTFRFNGKSIKLFPGYQKIRL
jgi:hypothetical protein